MCIHLKRTVWGPRKIQSALCNPLAGYCRSLATTERLSLWERSGSLEGTSSVNTDGTAAVKRVVLLCQRLTVLRQKVEILSLSPIYPITRSVHVWFRYRI